MSPAEEKALRESIAQQLEAEAREYDELERVTGRLAGSSAAGVLHVAAGIVREGAAA